MKVLVTGGAGFIGSHLVDRLITEGHEAIAVDDLSSGSAAHVHPQAAFYRTDIRDSQALSDILTREKPQVVFHHAAQAGVRYSVANPVHDASVNVIGLLNLLEACQHHRTERFIFASSGGAIYGEQETFPADATHPLQPVSPYGVSKLACEHYLRCFHSVHGLSYAALRYANVYGPRQSTRGESGVIALFADRLLRGEPVHINGDGCQTRDFVYVDDVVEANVLAMQSNVHGALNVGTGVETSINDIFVHLKGFTRSSVHPEYAPAKAGEQRRSVLDISRIARQLDWRPRTALPDGLARTVAYFASRTEHG